MSVLIKNVRLQGEHVDILIRNGRFDSIGANIDAQAETVIDGRDKAIVPSLHNCHTHAAMTLMRGYADDVELHSWLADHIWPLEARLSEEDVYWGTKLACLEMIKSGTTFFVDMYWHWRGTARAVEEMGLRAALSAAFFDFEDSDRAEAMKRQVMDLHLASREYSDRIQFILGPHAMYTVSAASLRWIAEYAVLHGLRVHMHLSETIKEVEDCLRLHGKRPARYLQDVGLLGPNLSVAHGIWLDEDELDLLASHGVQLVHTPVSNLKLCSGSFEYAVKRRHGLSVALGTDGCASNNNLDMFEDMKFSTLLAKLNSMDPTVLPAQEAFDMATINGARMFGLESGRIATGMLADCLLLDLRHVHLVPGHNLVSDMVYSGNGGCVDTTICNGRVLMRDGRVEGEEEIVTRARECAERLVGKSLPRRDGSCF